METIDLSVVVELITNYVAESLAEVQDDFELTLWPSAAPLFLLDPITVNFIPSSQMYHIAGHVKIYGPAGGAAEQFTRELGIVVSENLYLVNISQDAEFVTPYFGAFADVIAARVKLQIKEWGSSVRRTRARPKL